MGQLFTFPIAGKPEDVGNHTALHIVMQANLNVFFYRQLTEQADILEGTGDTGLIHLNGIHAGGLHTVQQDGAAGGLIDLGEQVEHRGFSSAVGANESRNLGSA